MLTTLRWVTLSLAVGAACSWAVVSSIRVAYGSPSLAELTAHGAPRRYSDPIVAVPVPRTPDFIARNASSLRLADILLRIAAALFVSAHLVVLNLWRPQR